MAIQEYPSTLPGPSFFALEPAAQVLPSENEMGPRTGRRRTRDRSAICPVRFRFLETDYATFVAWYRDSLLNGVRRFSISLPSPAGITTLVARFNKPYIARMDGHRHWEVQADLELRERTPTSTAQNYIFLEDFENGFAAYALVQGSLTPFRIQPGMTGNAMHSDPYTASQPAIIQRTLPASVSCSFFSVRFRCTTVGSDDALVLELRLGITSKLVMIPIREGFYDAARRVSLSLAGSQKFISPAQITINRIYRLEITFAVGTNATVSRLIDEETDALVQQSVYTAPPFEFDSIRFTLDPSAGTCETDYDDIYALSAD